MAVTIKITGPKNKHEYQFSLILKTIFEQGMPNGASGEIIIAGNVQLLGQNPRDVDLVVCGSLSDAHFNLVASTKQSPEAPKLRQVILESFCFTIEVKEHDSRGVEMCGTNMIVKYGSDKKDATSQSEGQKYSLSNYLKYVAPDAGVWICNFLWMQNLTAESITQMTSGRPHNILPRSFSLSSLLQSLLIQYPPYELKSGNKCLVNCLYSKSGNKSANTFQVVEYMLTATKPAIGELARKNVERIVGKEIDLPEDLLQALGKKLVIVSGRAGTGKTVKMLKLACDLSVDQGRRCLFLTYNRALVNDIKRTLYFADVPTDFATGSVEIMTMHEFVRKLAIALGITTSKEYLPTNHLTLCSEITECIEAEVITRDDILDLMKERHELACWDQIFVDEAQDCAEEEKEFLYKFFGYQKLVIADGVDQFVRGLGKVAWGRNIYVIKASEKRSLRQKKNLATFVNDYATEMALKWHVDVLPELLGGKVIISDKLLPFDVIEESRKQCYEQGNKAFEMLFLTPPCFVVEEDGKKQFSLLDKFQKNGFNLWDGTGAGQRSNGFPQINQHRLLQYDSCRGLEGWCVVCLGFDKLIEYRANNYDIHEEEIASKFTNIMVMDSEEMKQQFVGLWSLIPLTRAIDTLIITLSDPKSKIGKIIRDCSSSDFVELI